MDLEEYWAYDFTSQRNIEEMYATLNTAGPWDWTQRDSGYYGEYLNTRPEDCVRVRIHEFYEPKPTFSILLQIEKGCSAKRSTINKTAKRLLKLIGAAGITKIEPYD